MIKRILMSGKLVVRVGDNPLKLETIEFNNPITETDERDIEFKLDHLSLLAGYEYYRLMDGRHWQQIESFEYQLTLEGEVGKNSYTKDQGEEALAQLFDLNSKAMSA